MAHNAPEAYLALQLTKQTSLQEGNQCAHINLYQIAGNFKLVTWKPQTIWYALHLFCLNTVHFFLSSGVL